MARWEAAGLLRPGQARAIVAFEGAGREGSPASARPGSPVPILSVVGALVLGLGLIALVAANWGTLPREFKFAGLVLLTLLSYGAGYALRDRPGARWPGTGAALYLLGGVLFGAVLGFLAQGMQLGVSSSTLLMLWGAGLLVLAYGVRLPPALHLAVPLGAVIPLTALYGLGWVWLAENGAASGLTTLICGLVALGLAWWHDHRWPTPDKALGRELGHPWAFWAVPLTLGGLGGAVSDFFTSQGADILTALLLGVAAFWLFEWGQHEGRRAMQSWALWGLGLSLYALCWGVGEPPVTLLGGALALGLALWGGRHGERRLINLGLVGVGIAVLSFYFSVFSALLSISLVLVGAGLLLLGIGYGLERARRRLGAASPAATGGEG